MSSGGGASTPMGHMQFCSRHPGQCARIGGNKAKHKNLVILTKKTWSELVSVNSSVNRRIRSQTDWKTHGKVDVWSLANSIGDCEDYAIGKRYQLLRKGWPSNALLLTTAWDHLGRAHAVLLVKTSAGDFVLDNLTGQVRPWRSVPYRWAKRQSRSNPRKWVKLAGYRAPKGNYKHLASKEQARKELNRILRKINKRKSQHNHRYARRIKASTKIHDSVFADH